MYVEMFKDSSLILKYCISHKNITQCKLLIKTTRYFTTQYLPQTHSINIYKNEGIRKDVRMHTKRISEEAESRTMH